MCSLPTSSQWPSMPSLTVRVKPEKPQPLPLVGANTKLSKDELGNGEIHHTPVKDILEQFEDNSNNNNNQALQPTPSISQSKKQSESHSHQQQQHSKAPQQSFTHDVISKKESKSN